MNNYETLYIIAGDTADNEKENLVKRFEEVVAKGGGTVTKTDKWGTRRLAYPINFKTEGYYVLMEFSGPAELPKELERQMRIADEIVRFVVVRKEDTQQPKKDTAKA